MAFYRYGEFLKKLAHSGFEKLHRPGQAAEYSGIHRCQVCGREEVSKSGDPLPPQNHHQHNPGEGPIVWRLVAAAQHKPTSR